MQIFINIKRNTGPTGLYSVYHLKVCSIPYIYKLLTLSSSYLYQLVRILISEGKLSWQNRKCPFVVVSYLQVISSYFFTAKNPIGRFSHVLPIVLKRSKRNNKVAENCISFLMKGNSGLGSIVAYLPAHSGSLSQLIVCLLLAINVYLHTV